MASCNDQENDSVSKAENGTLNPMPSTLGQEETTLNNGNHENLAESTADPEEHSIASATCERTDDPAMASSDAFSCNHACPAASNLSHESSSINSSSVNDKPESIQAGNADANTQAFESNPAVQDTTNSEKTKNLSENLLFAEKSFVFSSNSSPLVERYKVLIETHGGKISDKLIKSVNYILVFEEDEIAPTQKMVRGSVPLIRISFIDAALESKSCEIIDDFKIVIENIQPLSSEEEQHITPKREHGTRLAQPTPSDTPTRRSARLRSTSSVMTSAATPKRPRRMVEEKQKTSLEKENCSQINVLIECPTTKDTQLSDLPAEAQEIISEQSTLIESGSAL